MTNLLVVRNHSELGSVKGVFGKNNRSFDFRWGSHDCWFNGKLVGDEDEVRSWVDLFFALCEQKMLEQGIEDESEIPFVARIEGRKVTKLVVLSEEYQEEEYQRALSQI